MTVGQAIAGSYPYAVGKSRLSALPTLIVSACALFNFVLCFLNTAGFPISGAHVVLCEMLLVSLSVAFGFYRADKERYFWLVILIAQFVLLSFLSIVRDEMLLKAFRDVMIMPVFVALGLASGKINFSKPLLWLGAFIGAVALFEAFSLNTFTNFFNIKDYYIAKGYSAESFQYTSEDVFVSGIRPGGRFFLFPLKYTGFRPFFWSPFLSGFMLSFQVFIS